MALDYLLSCKWAVLASSRETRERTLKKCPLLSYFVSLEYLKKVIYQFEIHPMLRQQYEVNIYRPEVDTSITAVKGEEWRERVQPYLLHLINSKYSDYMQVFTDGFVMDEREAVGSGVFVPFTSSKFGYKLPEGMSIFSAEVWALFKAVLQLMDQNWSKTIILTDSLSALQALQNSAKNNCNFLLAELKAALYRAKSNGLRIVLLWIPTHKGIYGNEEADKIARKLQKTVSRLRLGYRIRTYLEKQSKPAIRSSKTTSRQHLMRKGRCTEGYTAIKAGNRGSINSKRTESRLSQLID